MTEQEKYIYNSYLEATRKLNNKPFRYRKDFDDFEKDEKYMLVQKLAVFFNKFKHLQIKDFFEAPYFVYNDKYFELQFYTTQKAIKAYSIYQDTFLLNNPDHEQTVDKIRESYKFIYNFCKSKNIKFNEYINYIEPGNIHSFLTHLRERHTTLYALFIFPNFDKIQLSYDNEVKKFIFGDTFDKLNFLRTKYYSSTKAKTLCVLFFNKLNTI